MTWKLTWQDEVQTNPLERTEDTTVLCSGTGPYILQIQGWPCCASSPEPKDGSRCATTGNASWKGRNEEAAPSSHAAWIAVQGEGPAHKHTCTHTQTWTHISFKIRFYNCRTNGAFSICEGNCFEPPWNLSGFQPRLFCSKGILCALVTRKERMPPHRSFPYLHTCYKKDIDSTIARDMRFWSCTVYWIDFMSVWLGYLQWHCGFAACVTKKQKDSHWNH